MSSEIILASASPRRSEILKNAGVEFTVCVSGADETAEGELSPNEAVIVFASQKAHDVAKKYPNSRVVGADTVVVCDGEILGKPSDYDDAFRMLRMLSGKIHTVYTGVCITENGSDRTFAEATEVEFYPLTDAQIDGYIKTGEPMDKAGAYGIQGRGAVLVKRINGDYLNVVGLPVSRLVRELEL